jgi:hypothetical protein
MEQIDVDQIVRDTGLAGSSDYSGISQGTTNKEDSFETQIQALVALLAVVPSFRGLTITCEFTGDFSCMVVLTEDPHGE